MDVWCNGKKMETAVRDHSQRLFLGYGCMTKADQNQPQHVSVMGLLSPSKEHGTSAGSMSVH